jgi:5'-3' exonuclease
MSVMHGRFNDDEEMIKNLKLLMMKSIKIAINTFPKIDNIMFVSDGGSWRNNLPVPEFLAKNDIEYKGNRVKDPSIDWDAIFGGYEDMMSTMKKNNINVYREKGVEGDDWAWFLSTRLNEEGTNVIIWSNDHDLMQLVKTNQDGCFTAWWEKDRGLYIEDKSDDDLNFLFNMNYNVNEEIFNDVQKNAKCVTKINPKEIVIDKIIRGDGGDNVLSIVLRRGKTSTKTFKVGKKDIDYTMDPDNDVKVKEWIDNLVTSKSYADRIIDNKTPEQIFEHFKYNRRLVELEEKNYPNDIYELMTNQIDYECNKDITKAEQIMQAQLHGATELFDTI